MIPFKRPMLAATLMPPHVEHTNDNILAEMRKLRFPVLATLKKDGIRAMRLNRNSVPSLLSRTLKLIPNVSIRERSLKLPSGFDMELWNPSLSYDEIESIVMSAEHERSDEIQFHVLDWFGGDTYAGRYSMARGWVLDLYDKNIMFDGIVVCPRYKVCHNATQLLEFFLQCEAEEGEGICFRTPDSPYIQKNTKDNRSTLREQYLVKLARFVYEEAVIIGFIEQRDEQGHPKGTLGALVVRSPDGTTFEIGSGWKRIRGHQIWMNRSKYLGKTVVYKHKPVGRKNKPRSPVYDGMREKGY